MTSDQTDHQGAPNVVRLNQLMLENVKVVLVDGGWTTFIKNLIGAQVKVAKRSNLYKFTVTPQHWFAERSFVWLEK